MTLDKSQQNYVDMDIFGKYITVFHKLKRVYGGRNKKRFL
jgi:hypothetical protein